MTILRADFPYGEAFRECRLGNSQVDHLGLKKVSVYLIRSFLGILVILFVAAREVDHFTGRSARQFS